MALFREKGSPDAAQDYYPAAIAPEEPDGLRGALTFLKRRRMLLFLATLLGSAAGGFYGFTKAPVYTAEARVVIEPKDSRVIDMQAVAAGLSADSSMVETQVSLVTSSTMLDQLVKRLNLVDPEALEKEEVEPTQSLIAYLESLLPENILVATGLAHEQPKLEQEASLVAARKSKAEKLARDLKVRQIGRSLIFSINYSHIDPSFAANVANNLADLYVQRQVDEKNRVTSRAVEWLELRTAELQEELIRAENEAQTFRAKNSLSEKGGVTLQSQQIMTLTNMLVDARAARTEKESRLRYLRQLQSRKESLNTLSEVMSSSYMERLWDQERQLQASETELLNTYGDKHPKVALIKAEIAKVGDKIGKEIQRIVDNMANEIVVHQAKEKSIQDDINKLVAELDNAGLSEVKLRELERQANASRALYESFLQRYKETREQLQLTESNARVVSIATPPTEPSSRPPVFFLLAGMLVAAAGGAGAGWVMERLDSTIRSGKDVEKLFGLPCLALVPRLSNGVMKKHGGKPYGYMLAKPLSVYSETIRSIFTAIQLSDIDTPPKVIHITSSVASEGKTTLSISLAASLAHYGHKVLIIDLDIRHPSVGRELGVEGSGQLVELLIDDVALDDAIRSFDEYGFDAITIGRQSTSPGALIRSKKMLQLLAILRERYDYIVLDGTPVLGVTDAKFTAALADLSLFVIRWEKTTKDVAEDALKELTDHQAKLGGVVITQVDLQKHARYGYGGIDHYYSKYQKYYVN